LWFGVDATARICQLDAQLGGAFPAFRAEEVIEGKDDSGLAGELECVMECVVACAGDALGEQCCPPFGREEVAVLIGAERGHGRRLYHATALR